MLLNIGDDKERHFLALQALLNPDDSRDDVLRKITQLAARMLKYPAALFPCLMMRISMCGQRSTSSFRPRRG